jgi:benzoyl-CoA reductase/2-hydroxyglutaryl-CoA dehydratase subunit BcrC/BadD/HgdB
MDIAAHDLSYIDALDLRHEVVSAECIDVVRALQSLDSQQDGDELEGELEGLEEELVRLGKEKAQLWTLIQEHRLKLSGTE